MAASGYDSWSEKARKEQPVRRWNMYDNCGKPVVTAMTPKEREQFDKVRPKNDRLSM